MSPMEEKKLFIETLKVKEGIFIHPELHLRRIQYTQEEAFGFHIPLQLKPEMVPADKRKGIVKCRILYGEEIRLIDFETYTLRNIRTLKLIDGGNTDYHLKYADRTPLTRLLAKRGNCDDILISIREKITDTSYSNVVLFDGENYYTPSSYLLNGTKRQSLIQQGIVREIRINTGDLINFRQLYLINAMLDIEDGICIGIKDILK